MNKSAFYYASIAVSSALLVLAGLHYLRRDNIQSFSSDSNAARKSNLSLIESIPTKPSASNPANVSYTRTNPIQLGAILFKSTNYPPQSAAEKAQWEWWQKMNKTDPAFQWKMPIEFYGKVVDQFGEPIPDAKILFQWTTVVGKVPDPEQQSWSGTDGRFELRNVQGKTLAVKVSKPGYTRTEDWAQGFEYAAFYQENFYVADPTNPTLFHLRKEIETEPLYLFKASDRLALNDHPRILELASGKMTAYGDFSFALKTLNRPNDSSSNFFVEIGALNGSGLILTKEEFPIRAPVSGYKTFLSIDYGQKNLDDNRQLSFTFYAKTHDDHYGLVFVEASMPSNEGSTVIRTVVRYNPSGSQNLEFDHTKWINR